ncbi:glutathione S-transferase [Triangularia verruculosa]|uniref:Glutathione S-transferase n=1 Tax=Triangularia verruculosa TaxID=2587418 RepID=A0AAN7ANP6_9PEZI|nr:glutathione S-transferase [Triangularia verruculosa]
MAPIGKIYTYPNNYRVQIAQVAADLNNFELEFPEFQMGVTNKTPEFLSKFPLGKAPAFSSADDTFHLTEGLAISRYIASSGPASAQLLGSDPKTSALIEQWALFGETELSSATVPPLLMVLAKMIPYDEARYTQCAGNLERAVKRLEEAVKDGRKFLVGDKLSLADLAVLGPMQLAGKFLFDGEMRKQAPSVEGYLKGLLEVPEVKKNFGEELTFCDKRVQG